MEKINEQKLGHKNNNQGMKIRSDSLGQILKGLSLSEKRMLSKRLQLVKSDEGDDPIFIKLFLALLKGQGAEQISELKNNPARLKHTKKYLIEKVLEILGQNSELSPRVAIYQWLSQAEVLYLKGFHHEALARLLLGLELAQTYEFWEESITLLEWLHKVKLHLGVLEEVLLIEKQVSEVSSKISELNRYRELHLRVRKLSMEEGLPRDLQTLENWKTLLTNPLLEKELEPLRTEMERRLIRSQCLLQLEDLSEAANELKQLLFLLKKKQQVLLSNPNTVIECWYLYLGICIELAEPMLIDRGFKTLEDIKFLSTTQNDRKNQLEVLLKARMNIKRGEYVQAIERLENLDFVPIQNADHTEWMFFLSVAQVFSKRYSQALKSLNEISFNPQLFGVHPALQNYLRILEIIVHWGLGNHEFIAHRAKALRYHLKKPGGSRKMEFLLVETLKKMGKLNKEQERREALLQLKKEAEKLSQESQAERNFMFYFNLPKWIDEEIR